jgi:hypothetical protein
VRDLDTKHMVSFGSKLVVLFAAQHKLILFDLTTLQKSDVLINFSWMSDGFVDKIDIDQRGNVLLNFGGRLTLCRLA